MVVLGLYLPVGRSVDACDVRITRYRHLAGIAIDRDYTLLSYLKFPSYIGVGMQVTGPSALCHDHG